MQTTISKFFVVYGFVAVVGLAPFKQLKRLPAQPKGGYIVSMKGVEIEDLQIPAVDLSVI